MTHVVLTGRDAKPELIAIADLVTEMAEIKHPFRETGRRRPARRGVLSRIGACPCRNPSGPDASAFGPGSRAIPSPGFATWRCRACASRSCRIFTPTGRSWGRRGLARLAAQGAGLVGRPRPVAGRLCGPCHRRAQPVRPPRSRPALAPLRARHGVFAVFGNHDWRNGPPDPQPDAEHPTIWHRAFAEAGVPVLSNAVTTLEAQGVPFQLAGLESQRAFKLRNPRRVRGADDLPAVMRGLDPSVFSLLMAHEPDVFPDLDETVDLTVSGHTHGGQIVPFGRPLVVPVAPWHALCLWCVHGGAQTAGRVGRAREHDAALSHRPTTGDRADRPCAPPATPP